MLWRRGAAAMMDSLYGDLPGLGGKAKEPAPAKKDEGNDMFSEAPKQPEPAPAAAAPEPEPAKAAPKPAAQAFPPVKLMMPPVRKKAEPVKKPTPLLDLQKLQEEKAALMRQRAEAASSKPAPASEPSASAAASGGALAATSSSTGGGSTNLYGSPDEEYDPAKPNDYDEFCRRRLRQKAEEEMERRRQETLARQSQATKAPEPPKEDDFATKMMKKMGWKDGAGLGKDLQGMSNPLVMKKTDQRTGVIEEAAAKRQAPGQAAGQPDPKQAKTAAPTFNRPPTRVLLLLNLVGAGEVDEDLEGETAEEAGKYGKLKKCVVKEVKNVPDTEAVRIFLEYEKVEDATKAMVDMNGRYFGGRVVKAQFYEELKFEKGELV